MAQQLREAGYRTYWSVWVVLLILTLAMILIGSSSAPRRFMVLFLILAMFAKAALITGTFMHLRFEKVVLTVTVAVGILFTAIALFFGIAPDAVRILNLSAR
jgi:cytochrome c oxidase subunit IV